MTKTELVGVLAEKLEDCSKKRAAEFIDAFIEVVGKNLAEGKTVHLTGFGSFEVRQRAARKGHNPRNPQQVVDIPAKNVPVFHAGKTLRESVK